MNATVSKGNLSKLIGLKTKSALVLAVFSLFAFAQQAHAYCISGKIQYVNDWDTNSLGARLSGVADTTRPLRGLQVIWTRISGSSKQISTYTNASGGYRVCQAGGVTRGTWQMTLRWGDQGQRFRLVQSFNALTVVSVAPVPNVTITNSNKVMNYTILASLAYPTDIANAYDAAYEWFDTMAVKYGLATGSLAEYWSGMGTIQVVNRATRAAAGRREIYVPFATPTLAHTYFHELGHVLQVNMQEQATGCGFFDCSWSDSPVHVPACIHPATGNAHDTASEALMEGWADFVANIVSAAGNPPSGVGTTSADCQTCFASDPNAPACGTGSLTRSRSRVGRALGDLVDSENNVANCRAEDITLTVNEVVEVMVNSFKDGFGEGDSGESNPSAGSTPGIGNSNLKEDGLGLLDFLYHTEIAHGVQTRPIWANSCWQPGDASAALTD